MELHKSRPIVQLLGEYMHCKSTCRVHIKAPDTHTNQSVDHPTKCCWSEWTFVLAPSTLGLQAAQPAAAGCTMLTGPATGLSIGLLTVQPQLHAAMSIPGMDGRADFLTVHTLGKHIFRYYLPLSAAVGKG